MRPTIALAILITLPLAGCDWLDRAEGKNPNREYIERLALLEQRYATRNEPVAPAAVTASSEVAAVQPVIVPAPVVQPEPVPVVEPEPPTPAVCQAIFRVLSCSDSGEWIWL